MLARRLGVPPQHLLRNLALGLCIALALPAQPPVPPGSAYQNGLAALSRNDLAAARDLLERASGQQASDPRVWLALAQTYRGLKLEKEMGAALARVERLAEKHPSALHALSLFHGEKGDWTKAADYEARYAERNPEDREAFARAAALYLDAGQPAKAIDIATRGLNLEKRADLHNLLGKAYEAIGQPDQAILALQEAIRLRPYDESYYYDLAQVLLVHQNFEVAVTVLESARKTFDKSPQLELALGVAYYGQRRFGDAVSAFLRTTALAPDLPQPYIFLGRILNQSEDRLPEITERFAAYARAHPENALAAFLYAKALAAQLPPSGFPPQAQQAESLLRKSIELKDDHWETHYELGLLLERKRDLEGAAQALERSSRLNPKASQPHYRLARVYERLGKKAEAEAERKIHEQLAEEEKTTLRRQAAATKRLELTIK